MQNDNADSPGMRWLLRNLKSPELNGATFKYWIWHRPADKKSPFCTLPNCVMNRLGFDVIGEPSEQPAMDRGAKAIEASGILDMSPGMRWLFVNDRSPATQGSLDGHSCSFYWYVADKDVLYDMPCWLPSGQNNEFRHLHDVQFSSHFAALIKVAEIIDESWFGISVQLDYGMILQQVRHAIGIRSYEELYPPEPMPIPP